MKRLIASPVTSRVDLKAQSSAARASYAAARLGVLRGAAAGVLVFMASLANAAPSPSSGEVTEDIIGGCNQFIKFARKGRWRQDPDTMRQLGECIGAVRTMLATEIAGDAICPKESTKLIDAVTAFSLYVMHNPADLKTVYVVPLRQALRAAYPCSAIRQ
jgi:hypothetical protein